MHVKRTLLWGMLLYTIISICSPLMFCFGVPTIPIANFTVAQAIFFGIADHQICYLAIAGLLTMMLLIGTARIKPNRLGSLCGAFVVAGDLFHAGSMFVGDWFNNHVNTFAMQASMFDIVITLLYILYYVGQMKERGMMHKSSRTE